MDFFVFSLLIHGDRRFKLQYILNFLYVNSSLIFYGDLQLLFAKKVWDKMISLASQKSNNPKKE